MVDVAADAVLVVLDVTPGGALASSAAGLLGAASEVGTPVVLIVGEHADALAPAAAELGATLVLTANPEGHGSALGVPAVDALAAAVEAVKPDAVLLSHSIESRETAGRFAARSRSALCVDVVDCKHCRRGVTVGETVVGGADGGLDAVLATLEDKARIYWNPSLHLREGSPSALLSWG